jgi:hypothetical protein
MQFLNDVIHDQHWIHSELTLSTASTRTCFVSVRLFVKQNYLLLAIGHYIYDAHTLIRIDSEHAIYEVA